MRNKLTEDKPTLFVDQWGQCFWAKTAKELLSALGYGRASKMYQDKKDGSPVWIGYVIGPHLLTAFKQKEEPA